MNRHSNCCPGEITAAKWIRHRADRPPESNLTQQVKTFSSLWSDLEEQIAVVTDKGGRLFVLLFLSRPSFSWTRNGTHFDVEKDSKVLMKPGSGTLVIDISGEKAEAYEGTYQCTAQNDHGTAVTNKIVIRQSSKTTWEKKEIDLFCTDDACCEWCGSFLCCSSDSQGPPCGQRREMKLLWCRRGSRWCCSVDLLWVSPLLSSSGWITVGHQHINIFLHWSSRLKPRNLCICQTSTSSRWTKGCPRLWMGICTSPMSFLKTAGLTTSAMLASLTHKPSSRSSPFRSPCWTVSQGAENDGAFHFSPFWSFV